MWKVTTFCHSITSHTICLHYVYLKTAHVGDWWYRQHQSTHPRFLVNHTSHQAIGNIGMREDEIWCCKPPLTVMFSIHCCATRHTALPNARSCVVIIWGSPGSHRLHSIITSLELYVIEKMLRTSFCCKIKWWECVSSEETQLEWNLGFSNGDYYVSFVK